MTATTAAPAEMVAGAASHDVLDWHAIDWRRVHQTVRRLQVRIVKAIQDGRWGKVRTLEAIRKFRPLISEAPQARFYNGIQVGDGR